MDIPFVVDIPFVDVHSQTIAADLPVRSVPEAVTPSVIVILESWPETDRIMASGYTPGNQG